MQQGLLEGEARHRHHHRKLFVDSVIIDIARHYSDSVGCDRFAGDLLAAPGWASRSQNFRLQVPDNGGQFD